MRLEEKKKNQKQKNRGRDEFAPSDLNYFSKKNCPTHIQPMHLKVQKSYETRLK